jgi:acyl-CoA thioesterase-1
VRDQDDRGSRFAIERLEQLDDPSTGVAVQIPGRLVGEENARSVGEGAGDRHPLLFAAGELRREVVETVAEPDALEDVARAFHYMVLAPQLERHLHVLDRGECRDQLKALEDETDLFAAHAGPRILVHRRDVDSVEVNRTVRRCIKTGEETEESSFAAAGGTHDRDELALLDRERDVAQDYEPVIPALIFLRQAACREHMGIAWKKYALLVPLLGCAGDKPPVADNAGAQASAPPVVTRDSGRMLTRDSTRTLTHDARRTILFIGTSLTAGLGLEPDSAYPARLQRKIDSAGLPFTVVNAGVSGETSSALLGRLDWLMRQPLAIVIVETGANDGLRGVPVATMRSNIDRILERIRAARPGARVALMQMEALPNLGRAYTDGFREVFPEMAKRHNVTLLPFLLENVAGVRALNQGDGIHPNDAGERIVTENVWKGLRPMLR